LGVALCAEPRGVEDKDIGLAHRCGRLAAGSLRRFRRRWLGQDFGKAEVFIFWGSDVWVGGDLWRRSLLRGDRFWYGCLDGLAAFGRLGFVFPRLLGVAGDEAAHGVDVAGALLEFPVAGDFGEGLGDA
jgi:hypothetical protein